MDKSSRSGSDIVRVAATWAMVLIVVLVAAAMTIAVANARIFGPERVVGDYMKTLEQGDGATALGHLGLEAPAGNGLMLSGDPLKASTAALGDYEVEETAQEEDRASVRVSYDVGGNRHHADFRLVRTGRDWLFFDEWQIQMGKLPVVTVNASNTTDIRVNDVESPVAAGEQAFPVLPPAVVTASFEKEFFHAEDTTRVVDGVDDTDEQLQLVSQPTQALEDAVDRQLREYLDGCAGQQVLMPTGCPLAYDTAARVDPSTIDWEIADYPDVEIAGFDGGWVLRPLDVDVDLELVEQDLATGATTSVDLTETYTFTAKLELTSSDVSVTPVVIE
ncbi:hypothetical protein [Zhihengliuella salsuginis]|uniref:Uncharacterized protein n=1 Tax=Zhihengliuella salsuginis TaxID=578222 RepID=A0ABQ3GFN8_9MICC|nr:hypothetical protein [Zhihengliuella salsuginis]GHD02508.1 hypothetical protein GCM10008096_07730 [Zhihengliuella salsuginis]